LDPQQSGTVAGIFLLGLSRTANTRWPLGQTLERQEVHQLLLVAWGIFAVGCGLARTYHELLLLRLLLGVAEKRRSSRNVDSSLALVSLVLNERAPMRFGCSACRLR